MKDSLLSKKQGGEKGLLIAVIMLAVIGTVFIYSASNYSALKTYGDAFYFVKKQIKTLPEFNKEPFYPKFSIVKEEENQFMEKRRPDIVCPIESINGGETYGRKDSRAFIYLDV